MLISNQLIGFGATKLGGRPISIVISTDQPTSYNLFSAAGSPTDVVDVTVTINSGIKVSEMRGNSFANGSRVFIINNGFIYGVGGLGGAGASIFSVSPFGFVDSGAPATNGANGTDAYVGNTPVTLTNANGFIYGGGGGGAGGAGAFSKPPETVKSVGGSGGGGGFGYPGGIGNGGGLGTVNGNSGTDGTPLLAGTGGASAEAYYGPGDLYLIRAERGGDGGSSASGGYAGDPNAGLYGGGASPGAQGKAINVGGRSIVFISGSGNASGGFA